MNTKVYERILGDVRERGAGEIKEVNSYSLSPYVEKWVARYRGVGDRPEFIWKWLFFINKTWKHVEIEENLDSSLAEIKTLYNMFLVLIDDVAEEPEREDLLASLIQIPFSSNKSSPLSNKDDKEYFEFAVEVWQEIIGYVGKSPHCASVYDFFVFDTFQFLNAVRYANLMLKHPLFLNEKEYWLYIPHSMQIMLNFDLDIMSSVAGLDTESIGVARHTVSVLQEMARVGNWVSTWEREVLAGDYSSLVVARAVRRGFVSIKELRDYPQKATVKIKKNEVEKSVLEDWEAKYAELRLFAGKQKVINPDEVQEKARYLLFMHLSSRGYK